MADAILPLLLCIIGIAVLWKREPVYEILMEGGQEGLRTALSILPALVMLLSSVSMLRASGLLGTAAGLLRPLASLLGIPPETVLLMLVRPLSGSAALAIGTELISSFGADSLIGRTAAVMLGSTETTFYVISVYFGACGIRSVRYAPIAALTADFVGFLSAAATVRWLFPIG